MKPVLLLLGCLICPVLALEPGVPDPHPTYKPHGVDPDTGLPVLQYDWIGTEGWTYFPQWSDDLVHWHYYQAIDFGVEHEPIDTPTDASKQFLRLRFTNIPTTDPNLADFDGDGVSNIDELEIYHTDPFDPDTDHDGIPDGAEILAGKNPLNSSDGNPLFAIDSDGDGLSDAAEALLGTSPLLADSDGDGVPDNMDAFPLDPSRSSLTLPDPGDTTPPTVTLDSPSNAIEVSGP